MFNFSRLRLPLHGRIAFSTSLPKSELRASFRRFSTEPPKPKSTAPYAALGVAAAGGIAYYYYYSIATNAGASAIVKAEFKPTREDFQKVYNRIAESFDQAGEYDDGSYAPVILRLAWHSAGTYDKETNTGGR